MPRCFIALGSNLDQPLQQVCDALPKLATLPSSRLGMISPWYQSKAIGPGEQGDYINGVAELYTELPAEQLLQQLHRIEASQNRQRIEHWGPRTLDLDLLLYGQQQFNTTTLTVPHPRMLERNFVLLPLYTIAPQLQLPNGKALADYLPDCDQSGIKVYQL